MKHRGLLLILFAITAVNAPAAGGQDGVVLTVGRGESLPYNPGYLIGDIGIADAKVADFRVNATRADVVLIGQRTGRTSLTIWDQEGRLRSRLTIDVADAGRERLVTDLRAALSPFGGVSVGNIGEIVVVSGTVATARERDAVTLLAQSVGARSLLTLAERQGSVPAAAEPTRLVDDPARPEATAPIGAIDYQITLLEASSQFRTGSYARGIEPSGRLLHSATLRATCGAEQTVTIGGGKAAAAKTAGGRPKGRADQANSALRLTVQPSCGPERDTVATAVTVETNLPIDSPAIASGVWRRARLDFTARLGEPFGITGGDLLASPELPHTSSTVETTGRVASTVSRGPGLPRPSALGWIPILGSLFASRDYSEHRTQLLVVIRAMKAEERDQ